MTETENRTLEHSVCNLAAGSHYNCSLTAKNNHGEGEAIFSLIWTAPDSEYTIQKFCYFTFQNHDKDILGKIVFEVKT